MTTEFEFNNNVRRRNLTEEEAKRYHALCASVFDIWTGYVEQDIDNVEFRLVEVMNSFIDNLAMMISSFDDVVYEDLIEGIKYRIEMNLGEYKKLKEERK